MSAKCMKSTFTSLAILLVLIAGVVSLIGVGCNASRVRAAVGTVAVSILQQTWPPAFADSALWASGWIWALEDLVGLEFGISYYDLKHMQFSPGSSYYGAVILQPLSFRRSTLGARLGVVRNPTTGWTSPFGGAVVSTAWTTSFGTSISGGLATVDPRRGCPLRC